MNKKQKFCIKHLYQNARHQQIEKKAIEQQLQGTEAEWTVNVDYLEAMIQDENLENINLSYESLSQQQLQLDKLCDDLFKTELTQNELREIMDRSAELSLVILE